MLCHWLCSYILSTYYISHGRGRVPTPTEESERPRNLRYFSLLPYSPPHCHDYRHIHPPNVAGDTGRLGRTAHHAGKAPTLCGILSIMIMITTFFLIMTSCFVSSRRQARQVLVQRSTETIAVAICEVQHLAGGKAIARTAIVRFSRPMMSSKPSRRVPILSLSMSKTSLS